MSQVMIDLVAHVVGQARMAGLDHADQCEAAVAALMAAMPHEAPAIAHLMVELLVPAPAEG